ncbi:MAG: PilX N-terminal domain-containing pilus assembly protein [Pseudomonadota bacterium]
MLVTSLILLLVMTLLGLSAMQTSLMEETMAGNVRDHNLAFQAAEAALRDADAWLYSLPRPPETPVAPDPIPCAPPNPPVPTENVYAAGTLCDIDSVTYNWPAAAIQFDSLVDADLGTSRIGSCDPAAAPPDYPDDDPREAFEELSALPCLLIEEYDFIPDDLNPDTRAKQLGRHYFRITALGLGGTNTAQSIIQTILFQRYN